MLISKNISPAWKLLISVMVCESVGFISGFLTMTDMNIWFDTLNKPSWNPPSDLFGPVWTALYLLMGVSLWLVWKSPVPYEAKKKPELIFIIQLLLNFCWSFLFFKCHSPSLAFADIILMLIAILLTIISFSKVSRLAAVLLIPYIGWVSFAAILNYTIWIMNS